MLGVVLLAATAAQAEDRKCIREDDAISFGDMTMTAKRQCDPKNFVTDPNEYGWVCDYEQSRCASRARGKAAKGCALRMNKRDEFERCWPWLEASRAYESCGQARTRRRVAGDALGSPGRSTRDLLNLLATISERGASFRSLRDTWADTTNAHGRLIITVLAGLAEFERELIRSRCGEGISERSSVA